MVGSAAFLRAGSSCRQPIVRTILDSLESGFIQACVAHDSTNAFCLIVDVRSPLLPKHYTGQCAPRAAGRLRLTGMSFAARIRGPMKSPLLRRKADRRQHVDRRIRARHEGPDLDLSLADSCPQCGSTRFELVDATNERTEFRCRTCLQTWITLPRKLRP